MTFRIKNILAASVAVAWTVTGVSAQVAHSLGNLPLYFEAQGSGGAVQFLARSQDGQVLISPAGAQLTLRGDATVRAQFLGASPQAQIHGEAELTGKINYLTGNDPAQWRIGIPTFSQVRVANLYPGIDAVYYGNQRQLEYDLKLAAGAGPEQIAIRFQGVDKISVNAQGQLALFAGQGEIDQAKPVIYQLVPGARREISGGYKMVDARTVAFVVGPYDHRLPLVIDPILSYSTYFGGPVGQSAHAVAVSKTDGSIYMAGEIFSPQILTNGMAYSTTNAGVYQPAFHGGGFNGDAFVARFDNTGQNLIYFTYLGGNADDAAFGLAVDGAGDAYVTGFTDSTNFPVHSSITGSNGVPGLATNLGGVFAVDYGFYLGDAFVAELNPTGSKLVYSTYLGGSLEDSANAIALDSAGNAYVAGYTYSTNFPVINPIQSHLACTNNLFYNANAFVTEIASNGTGVVFSTYLGGTNFDEATGIAVGNDNRIYVTGFTSSTNFPNTNSFQLQLNEAQGITNQTFADDAFVAKYEADGTKLLYSTFLGSSNNDMAFGIAVDNSGAAYVTGWTTSTNFPHTTATNFIANGLTNITLYGAIVTTNAFLTKIIQTNPASPATIAYSVIFGGRFIDWPYGVAVDPAGDAFVTGATTSTNFPVFNTLGLLRATNSALFGSYNAFVTAFNTNCTQVLYSAYLGGRANDYGYGIAVDSDSTAYVVGQTTSTNFPVTTAVANLPIYNALSKSLSGTNDAFLAKILITQYQPAITIAAAKTNAVTVSWPGYAELQPHSAAFRLESNTNLATATWVTITNPPVLSNSNYVLTLPATNQYQFFRLTN